VINIGSVDGIRIPHLETYAYSASKAAVHQLTRVMAYQLADRHVTVNAIAAGPFPSKMMKATLDKFYDTIVENVPLKRIGGPIDIGGAIVWLLSDAGSWITGAIIPVDGGCLVRASL
jgi:NAD(P)-dependent dehydrogenase (short-subunit alcohol dehydrogenase family)